MISGTHPQVPLDHYADSHGQIGGSLKQGQFLADERVATLLRSWGWDGAPITTADVEYLLTHAGAGGRSLMSQLVAALFAWSLIGGAPVPQPPGDGYPGQPQYDECWRRLSSFGVVVGTTPGAEKRRFVGIYWQERLTAQRPVPSGALNDEEWLATERGLWLLPEAHEVGADVQRLFAELELAIGWWGLAAATAAPDVEPKRAAAAASYWSFEGATIPPPGTPAAPATLGALVVNPRYILNYGRKVENPINQAQPSPFGAALACTRLGRLVGVRSRYDGYAMQTQPLYEADWRAVLGLPPVHGQDSSGLHIDR